MGFKEFQADFDNMTDEEVEREREYSQSIVDEHQPWLDAVAMWEAAGKPRTSSETQESRDD